MSSVSYQTIKLSRGKHSSPEDGACVMELASMLAGERFSDHPASVCPVIGSVLRAYNDSVDDDRRQDLYAYAAKVVGSSSSPRVQLARADCLAVRALRKRDHRWIRSFLPDLLRALGLHPQPPIDTVGMQAIRSISKLTDETHAAVLALIDELLAIDAREEPAPPPTTPETRAALGRDRLTGFVYGAHLW
jgi:hypothetical protein